MCTGVEEAGEACMKMNDDAIEQSSVLLPVVQHKALQSTPHLFFYSVLALFLSYQTFLWCVGLRKRQTKTKTFLLPLFAAAGYVSSFSSCLPLWAQLWRVPLLSSTLSLFFLYTHLHTHLLIFDALPLYIHPSHTQNPFPLSFTFPLFLGVSLAPQDIDALQKDQTKNIFILGICISTHKWNRMLLLLVVGSVWCLLLLEEINYSHNT
jgi:hypothetical protein